MTAFAQALYKHTSLAIQTELNLLTASRHKSWQADNASQVGIDSALQSHQHFNCHPTQRRNRSLAELSHHALLQRACYSFSTGSKPCRALAGSPAAVFCKPGREGPLCKATMENLMFPTPTGTQQEFLPHTETPRSYSNSQTCDHGEFATATQAATVVINLRKALQGNKPSC